MDGGQWLRAAKRRDTGPAAALGGGSLPVKLGIELPVDKCYGTKTKTKLGNEESYQGLEEEGEAPKE
jgi:hypothetical protein